MNDFLKRKLHTLKEKRNVIKSYYIKFLNKEKKEENIIAHKGY